MIDLKKYWWPLATLAELDAGSPLARTLHGIPLVLFRDNSGQPAILLDRCPHRHATLSCGRIRQGEVECPYHGWRFDGEGCCTRVPGLESETRRHPLVRSFVARVAHGLIWACLAPDASTPEPVAPSDTGCRVDAFFMTDTVRCSIVEASENFLDGFHTHFVHAGWIRRDSKRQTVRAQIRRLADGVEAHYSEEGLQFGLISTLLENDRAESMGRFHLPGVAEIEYRGKNGLSLLITAWLTPGSDDQLYIHARIATRRGLIPAGMKKMLLRCLFGVILRQDKTILEQTHTNIANFAQCQQPESDVELLDSPLDLLGPSIRRLMKGEIFEEPARNMTVKL